MTYQTMPSLTAEEYAALKADIARRGVVVPVVVDQHGATLDGHHRLRAVAELRAEGVVVADPPTVRVECANDAERREHALKLNLLRRQLNPVAWAQLFRDFAAERGVRLGQGKRNDRTSATLAEVAAEVGLSERTARRRLALAVKVADHPDLAARVETAGTRGVERAIREREKQRQYEQRRAEAAERMKQRVREGTVGVYDLWTSPRRWLLHRAEAIEHCPYYRHHYEQPAALWALDHIPAALAGDALTIAAVDEARARNLRRRREAAEREDALQQWLRDQARLIAEPLRRAAEEASDEPTILVGRRYDNSGGQLYNSDMRNLGLVAWESPHAADGCVCGDAIPFGCAGADMNGPRASEVERRAE